jgi:serine/threonine protein kinase
MTHRGGDETEGTMLDDRIESLRLAQLLDPEQLAAIASDPGLGSSDPEALVGELQRRAWLTPFQAKRILGGRAIELLVGLYLLLEPLGAGGMGRVFLARHRTAKRNVALKVIRDGLGTPREDLARFRRTIVATARWTYPSILTVDLLGEADGFLYVVME